MSQKKPDNPFLKKASGAKPPTRSAMKAQQKHGGLGRVGRGLDNLITPTMPAPAVVPAGVAAAPSTSQFAGVAPSPAQGPLAVAPAAKPGEAVQQVPPWEIERSPWQPRTEFSQEALEDLVESIRQNGIIQPLTCRHRDDGKLELICGERRLRASIEAGLKLVPVILKEVDASTAAVLTITENLQRDDLNPIDEAVGFRTLKEEFKLTYEEVAERVGKKGRSTIANAVGLLDLPEEVQGLIRQKAISVGHAKVLQGLLSRTQNVVEVCELAKACVAVLDPRTGKLVGGMTVRELERRIVKLHAPVVEHRSGNPDLPDSYVRSVTEEIHRTLGCAVRLKSGMTHANGKHTKGVLEIDFIDNDDLDRILAMMGVKMD